LRSKLSSTLATTCVATLLALAAGTGEDNLGVFNRTQEQGDRFRQVEPFVGQWEILNLVVDRFSEPAGSGCRCGRLTQSSGPLPT